MFLGLSLQSFLVASCTSLMCPFIAASSTSSATLLVYSLLTYLKLLLTCLSVCWYCFRFLTFNFSDLTLSISTFSCILFSIAFQLSALIQLCVFHFLKPIIILADSLYISLVFSHFFFRLSRSISLSPSPSLFVSCTARNRICSLTL